VFVKPLEPEQAQRPVKITRTSRDRVRLRRAGVVLASVQGRSASEIAQMFAASEGYVREVIHAFNETEFAALDPKRSGGRARKFGPAVAAPRPGRPRAHHEAFACRQRKDLMKTSSTKMRWVVGAVVPTALAVTMAVVTQSAAAAPARECTEVAVPVTFQAAVPATVHGTYCAPTAAAARAVQVLVHGATYDRHYWDRVSDYPAAANAAGYATLAIDKVGYGQSTHLPSVLITAVAEAGAVHQVIAALRAGTVTGTPAPAVVLVGHSVGSAVSMIEAATYHDADAVVLTGMTHHLSPDVLTEIFTSQLYPAPLDPVASRTWPVDAGMLTTVPGQRAALFYSSAVPAEVVEQDEATKGGIAATEAADAVAVGFTLATSRGITAPVLVVNGTADNIFCAGALGVSCATPEAVAEVERPYFGPEAQLATAVVPGAGHSLTFEPNAEVAADAIHDWLATVPLSG
jgi:pimeloyl-ACP methyl ester carboxylesterase